MLRRIEDDIGNDAIFGLPADIFPGLTRIGRFQDHTGARARIDDLRVPRILCTRRYERIAPRFGLHLAPVRTGIIRTEYLATGIHHTRNEHPVVGILPIKDEAVDTLWREGNRVPGVSPIVGLEDAIRYGPENDRFRRRRMKRDRKDFGLVDGPILIDRRFDLERLTAVFTFPDTSLLVL